MSDFQTDGDRRSLSHSPHRSAAEPAPRPVSTAPPAGPSPFSAAPTTPDNPPPIESAVSLDTAFGGAVSCGHAASPRVAASWRACAAPAAAALPAARSRPRASAPPRPAAPQPSVVRRQPRHQRGGFVFCIKKQLLMYCT